MHGHKLLPFRSVYPTANHYVLDYPIFVVVMYAHDLRPGDTVAVIESTNLHIPEGQPTESSRCYSKVDHCATGNCASLSP